MYDTVRRFYVEDVGLQCPSASSTLQADVNNIEMQKCASVSLSPLLLIVQPLRETKRHIVLVLYHTMRVCFRLLEVFVAVTVDAAANLAQEASNAVQVAAEALLKECHLRFRRAHRHGCDGSRHEQRRRQHFQGDHHGVVRCRAVDL